MRHSISPTTRRVFSALPYEDQRLVLAGCEPIDLGFTDVLMEPGERIHHT
jgi:hypothetical protein